MNCILRTHKFITHCRYSTKAWNSPIPLLIPLSYNIYILNGVYNPRNMTEISTFSNSSIYFKQFMQQLYHHSSYNQRLTRRYDRNKSISSTNYYSILIYHSHRVNIKYTFYYKTNTYNHILHLLLRNYYPPILNYKNLKTY